MPGWDWFEVDQDQVVVAYLVHSSSEDDHAIAVACLEIDWVVISGFWDSLEALEVYVSLLFFAGCLSHGQHNGVGEDFESRGHVKALIVLSGFELCK